MKYLLDTNVVVRALRGNRRIAARLGRVHDADIAISAVTMLELLYGAAKANDVEAAMRDALELIVPWECLPLAPIAKAYGIEKARLARAGLIISEFDIIGVTGVSHGYTVVTDNVKHLERIDGINIENWQR